MFHAQRKFSKNTTCTRKTPFVFKDIDASILNWHLVVAVWWSTLMGNQSCHYYLYALDIILIEKHKFSFWKMWVNRRRLPEWWQWLPWRSLLEWSWWWQQHFWHIMSIRINHGLDFCLTYLSTIQMCVKKVPQGVPSTARQYAATPGNPIFYQSLLLGIPVPRHDEGTWWKKKYWTKTVCIYWTQCYIYTSISFFKCETSSAGYT